MGFEKTMNAILDNLPTEDRQTLLFSATQTRSVKGKRERSGKTFHFMLTTLIGYFLTLLNFQKKNASESKVNL